MTFHIQLQIPRLAILYADDRMIYAHNESPFQATNNTAVYLDLISEYYKTWDIDINAAKSEAICFLNEKQMLDVQIILGPFRRTKTKTGTTATSSSTVSL